MLIVLDYVFFLSHLIVILFNLFGWIPLKTRKLHLVVLLLTLGSWFALGFWKGFGYCFLTDWHWQIKEKLGEHNLPASFIKYLVDELFNIESDPQFIDILTFTALLIALCCSIYLNIRIFGFFKNKA